MRAIKTPPRKLLNVVKKINCINPGTSLMVANVSLILSFLRGCASVWSSDTWARWFFFSGMVNVNRWSIASTIIPAAPAIAQPMPRNQITNPLATAVTVNHTPLMVPIFPLAWACSSLGKSSETVVERAIVRRLPIIVPVMRVTISSQSCQDDGWVKTSAGVLKYTTAPSIYALNDPRVDRRITRCLGWWSTIWPNCNAVDIFARAKNHPMSELIINECVCKNTQNTKANHTKELVTLATSEFHSRIWKIVWFEWELDFIRGKEMKEKYYTVCHLNLSLKILYLSFVLAFTAHTESNSSLDSLRASIDKFIPWINWDLVRSTSSQLILFR